MVEYVAARDPDRCPTHPGKILAGALEAIGEPKTHIAEHLGISRQHLNDILGARKPITANVAVRIGKLIGNGPGIWQRMQANHDAWHAARAVDLDRIPTLKAKAA
jgi:addiction module HigA family antidote